MTEVAVFLGQATAIEDSDAAKAGNRHAVIVFLTQESGAEPNFLLAQSELAHRGWKKVKFSKAVHGFPVENLNSIHPHAGASYEDALTKGFAAIVFNEPISDAL